METKTLIAIPCMDQIPVMFANALLGLEFQGYTEVRFQVSSLIYDARNILMDYAVENDFTHILWLDSDMVFKPSLLLDLFADLEEGRDIVTALAFARRPPYSPCIYKKIGCDGDEHYTAYLKDQVFEVEGCGMAACVMKVDVARDIEAQTGEKKPFSPIFHYGEDLSFCMRAKSAGHAVFCDSRIKVGHLSQTVISESNYKQYAAARSIKK